MTRTNSFETINFNSLINNLIVNSFSNIILLRVIGY